YDPPISNIYTLSLHDALPIYGFWGLVIATLLTVHPLHQQWSEKFPAALRVEAFQLVVLAVAIGAWRLTYRPDFAWREWIALWVRSEEHTSELQSRGHLVCRLL